MDILENFRNTFLLFLPMGVSGYLVGSLTFDYFLIYKPDRLPDFMRKGVIVHQQIEARNGNIIPLMILRLLTAIASVTSAALISAIYQGFLNY